MRNSYIDESRKDYGSTDGEVSIQGLIFGCLARIASRVESNELCGLRMAIQSIASDLRSMVRRQQRLDREALQRRAKRRKDAPATGP